MNNVLDVGCGPTPRGTVNIDRYTRPTIHGYGAGQKSKIPNFVLADAQHLPFRNACFEKVVSSHVIEHVQEPMLMLKEMTRVSSRYVVVRCPHRFTLYRNKAHIHKFSSSWFRRAFQMLHWRVLKLPVRFGLFGIPEEIMVKAEKL